GTDKKALNDQINRQSIVRSKYNFYKNGTVSAELVARPLRDLHFTTDVAETPMFTVNNRMFVNSLFWVGILILLVALINYINFATANAPRRIKSISITRVIGSSRYHSVFNFILETVIIFALSFLIALGIAWVMNHYFTKGVLGYSLPFESNYLLIILFGAGSLILGALSGLYPAIYCTAGKPVETMKRFQVNGKVNFRGMLTVSQFAATIVLIAASILVIKQVRFMEKTNLGFQKENTLVIRMNNDLETNYTAFRDQLLTMPGVNGIARSRAVPGQAQEINTFNVNGQTCPIWYWAVDDQYIEMMEISIIEGRNFLKNSESEERNMICNETAARKFGWTIGTKIGDGVLVGIMKDFNFVSLREDVEPFAFWYTKSNNFFRCISIKLNSEHVSETLASIGKAYSEISPSNPMRYYFLDNHLNLLYSKENQQVKLITTFSLLSVIVSVLGILGLSTFMCRYRIKEIGIRKVNGAKVNEMMAMLNRDFIKWVIIAFLIGAPVAWYVMQQWLNSFAYKTNLSWWIFAVAGLLALIIAMITVSWQSWKAATRNPVEALRYE
ncbi:MAG TPA: FtsX-like permease family protein, partial [Prolixibacteraceae bacterium]|nr:FtsX-like permease family protein [Prolixibacteraceae bacterium]